MVTGATSAPSSAAITSLLPHAESTAAYLLQRPAVVSSGVDRSRSATSQQGDSSTPPHAPTPSPLLGGSSSLGLDHFCTPQILGLDFGLPLGMLPGIPETPNMRLKQQAPQTATEGHSSGHSGSGHLSPPDSPPQKTAVASGQGTCVGGKPATRTYQLRTRSSSLRAAWVEMEPEGKATGAAAEASTDSDGEAAQSGSDKEDEEEQQQKQEEKEKAPSRKRVGRPLAYNGNPDAPHLTDQERRKIKRRIANRESARRVRAKRAELMDELQIKCTTLGQQNARLMTHVALMENQKAVLAQQVGVLQEKLTEKANEALKLYNQLFALRKMVPAEMKLAHDPTATTPPASPLPMQGGNMFVPLSQSSPPDDYTGGSIQGPSFLL